VSGTGSYPDATPCSSTDPMQPASSSSITSSNTDVITVSSLFPLAASNPYQGGTATVALQEEYSGTTIPPTKPPTTQLIPRPTPTPPGAGLGVTTTSPTPSSAASPSKHRGVSAASTPTSGAQLPIVLSRILIVLGLGLVFAGLLVWRRQPYFGHG
jgi:hypothetical protein